MAARGACQQPGKLPTIGFLVAGTPSSHGPWVTGFVQRLRELGWIEGRTLAIEYRWAEARADRAAEIAAEFVRLKVDVIVTSATAVIVAVMQATSVIPIVFAAAGDPVSTGLVAIFATGRQRHRSVDAAGRSCWQAKRTFARGCPRSPPVGDLGQCRWSRRCAGYARGRGSGTDVRPRGYCSRNPRGGDIVPAFEALNGRADARYAKRGDPVEPECVAVRFPFNQDHLSGVPRLGDTVEAVQARFGP